MQRHNDKRDAFQWLRAVADLKADARDKSLLWALAFHADTEGTAYPSEETLRRESGLGSESTVRRTIRRLESRGWLATRANSRPVKIEGRTFYANSYKLTIPTGRAVTAMTGHDPETGGQIEGDGRSNQTSRAVKSHETGGHSYDRRTTKELPKNYQGMRERPALSQSKIEIPSLSEVQAFGAERGFPAERIEKCFRHYEASGWRDAQGRPVRNWRAKLSSWMNRPELSDANSRRDIARNHRTERASKEYPPNAKPTIE